MKNKRAFFVIPYVGWMTLFVVAPILIVFVYALTTAGGEDIDTSITGSDLEEIQFVLTELFAQDVMNCYTEDGEDTWDTADLLQPMTVD